MAETFTSHMKDAAWGGLEVGAAIGGAVLANKFLFNEEKIFKDKWATNPEWFQGGRMDAPWNVRYYPGLVAGGALLASTYINNPWIKMMLFGVAVAGGFKQLRILTWDKKRGDFKIKEIGDSASRADAELKKMAEQYRRANEEEVKGPEYGLEKEEVRGPEYSGYPGDRYESSIALSSILGDRYDSSVAGEVKKMIFSDDDDMMGFGFQTKDKSWAA